MYFENPFGRQLMLGSQSGTQEFDRPGSEAGATVSEAQRILQALLAQLPREAQVLVDRVSQELRALQDKTAAEVARIREQAEAQVAEAESKAEKRRRALLLEAAEQLEPLQKELFRAGELGKALATAVQILALRGRAQDILPDPGTLQRYAQVGKSFHFLVAGETQGAVWGTDVYTADSHLGSAAVHAGVLDPGEEGAVRVSIVDMTGIAVRGSARNGVKSMDWGPYPVGYRVTRAEAADGSA
jgi:hypothetical protein